MRRHPAHAASTSKNNGTSYSKRLRPARVLFVPTILIITCVAAYIVFVPNYKQIPFHEYYTDHEPGSVLAAFEGGLLPPDETPLSIDGALYFPSGFVKTYIDGRIFWDAGANRLTITSATESVYITAGETERLVNLRPERMASAVVNIGGEAYLPASLLDEFYGARVSSYPAAGAATVDRGGTAYARLAVTAKLAKLRYAPDIKSPVAAVLTRGDELITFEDNTIAEINGEELITLDAFESNETNNNNKFIKVRTSDGMLGYVEKNSLAYLSSGAFDVVPEPTIWTPRLDKKIVLAWDLVTNAAAAANPERRVANFGVNVISPTWFEFDTESLSGEIISVADAGFAGWAYENGIGVWALVSDNYDAAVAREILTNTNKREYAVRQLVALADEYKLDGINIDFERVTPSNAPYFLQFLRELSPPLRERKVILSVDLYVPEFTKYYDRAAIAEVADYICVMAYDEHASDSPVGGPVASKGFVEKGIIDTLAEVPAEKILLGLPFYARVWREEETDGGTKVTQRSYSMDYAREFFLGRGAEFVWLEAEGYYYAEYEAEDEAGAVYRTWLEDGRSIGVKARLAAEYGLAGAACWRRGLESDGIWEVIVSLL